MKQIANLKEKKLLIAHYFCEKTRKQLTHHEVFDMWSNWFKNDFRIKGKPVFCIENNELVYRKSIKRKDENIRKLYNQKFQNIYKWIKRTLEIDSHNKIFFKQELGKLRNKSYGRVLRLAKPLGIYIAMNTSYNRLAEFSLVDYKNRSHTITSGNCDKIIKYLQNMEKRNDKCNLKN